MNDFVVFVFLTSLFDPCSSSSWIEGLVSESHPGLAIEYVMYEDKLSWNEARSVCQGQGGDLAKIDSRNLLSTILEEVDTTFSDNIDKHDYWIGLTEVTEGQRQWVSDCSGVTWSDNYLDSWTSENKCYKLDKSEHMGELDSCDNGHSFLCERYLNTSCIMDTPLTTYAYNQTTSPNETECEFDCFRDLNCVVSIYTGNNSCLKVVLSNASGEQLHIAIKNCVSVSWIQTNQNPDKDNSDEPNIACGNINSVTSSTSIGTTTIPSTLLPPSSTIASSTTRGPLSFTSTVSYTSTIPPTTIPCTCPTSSTTRCPTVTAPIAVTCPQSASNYVNLTETEIIEIAEEISKNLTVDPRSTSAFLRRFSSAEDSRSSSTAVGFIGLVFVLVPLVVMLLIDMVGIYFELKRNIQFLLKEWRARIAPEVIVVGRIGPGDVFGKHQYV